MLAMVCQSLTIVFLEVRKMKTCGEHSTRFRSDLLTNSGVLVSIANTLQNSIGVNFLMQELAECMEAKNRKAGIGT